MSKLVWHQVVLFGVLALMTLLRLFTGTAGLNISLIWWWLGGVIGFLFVFGDRLVYAFMSNPDEALSIKLKVLFGKGKVINALAVALAEREKQDKLMMRSVLFVVVWAVLAVLTMTSVANMFSRGFMLGLGTHLIFDLGWDYWSGPPSRLRRWLELRRGLRPAQRDYESRDIGIWFWQIRNVTKKEIDIFVWGSFVFYFLIAWFM